MPVTSEKDMSCKFVSAAEACEMLAKFELSSIKMGGLSIHQLRPGAANNAVFLIQSSNGEFATVNA